MNPKTEEHNSILREVEDRMRYFEKEFQGCEEATFIVKEIQHKLKQLELLNK